MKSLLYIFLLIFCLNLGFSQTHIYKHFGVDEGLPSSEVYDMYQDKLGYIWFATDKGLSRYNGYEFENFTIEDGLPGNTIFDFYPQKNGEIWCYEYHSQKFFYFNENFDGFKSYKYNDVLKAKIKTKTILKNVVIDDGTLYTGGYGLSGLITIDRNGNVEHLFSKDSNVTDKPFFSKLGFVASNNTFFLLSHNYKLSKDYFLVNNKHISSSRLEVISLNKNQSLFIDRKIGLIENKKILKYFDITPNPIGIKRINDTTFFAGYYYRGAEIRHTNGKILQRYLPQKSVSNFLIDAEGSYWFSTLDDAVFYVKNPEINVLNQDHISSLVKTNDNELYAGYHNGNIGRLNNNQFDILYKGLNTDAAMVELNTVANEVYGYGDKKITNYTTNKVSYKLGARKLAEHIEDGIISNYGYGFNTIINDKTVQTSSNLNLQDVCIYNDDILLGTSYGLYIKRNNKVVKHQPVKMLSSRIDDIDLNKNTNMVYMATQGAGVIVYSDSIYNISKKNGLTNNIVSEVLIENDSIIWACTHSGLNRIVFKPNKTYKLTTITKADGLLSNDIDDVEIMRDTVWVATKKGLCYFKKSVIAEKETSNILSLSLKKITVKNKSIYEKGTKLKHSENNIDFKLQAISHKNNDNINYFYRLKEIDSSWTKTTNRTISFPSLSPGNYTFEAKAKIFNNPNDLITSYNFKILPPFWRSWWFYSISFVLFSGLVYLFFKIRVLTYNQDIFRELIRLIIKRLKRKEQLFKFRSNGEDFKIPTHEILYINSQGNYLDIITNKKTYTIRCKIGDFVSKTPDILEYLRIHRSYIIRIDQVSSKGKNWVVIKDEKIPVGETYLDALDKIKF